MSNEELEQVEVSEADFRKVVANGRTRYHPAHWPPDVREVSMEGLAYLGLDSKGRLYLDGDPVYTVRRWGQLERLIAVIGVVAALVGASAALVSAFSDVKALGPINATQVEYTHGENNAPLDLVLQVLGERADNVGAMAVSYPNASTRRGFLGAGGPPIEFGILDLAEKSDRYEVTAFLGNLSSAHLGNCHAEVTISKASGEHETREVPFTGYFKSGKANVFGFSVPVSLKGADQITVSDIKCNEALYEDGPAPAPLGP